MLLALSISVKCIIFDFANYQGQQRLNTEFFEPPIFYSQCLYIRELLHC